jgi:RNA polymerase sigma-70 factor (ECF subfamily)
MAEIFSTHGQVIYNYCYRRSGSWSAAEDLTSMVFLEVWKSRRRSVETAGSILPWLYGVATNVCRNYSRSQRRHSQALGRLYLADVDAPVTDDVVDQLDADRRLGRLLERLSQLPRTEQDVFVLVCWEELSYAETAQALGIPIGTVRSRLARVRRNLRVLDDQERLDV